jgi:hypothetical protein
VFFQLILKIYLNQREFEFEFEFEFWCLTPLSAMQALVVRINEINARENQMEDQEWKIQRQ